MGKRDNLSAPRIFVPFAQYRHNRIASIFVTMLPPPFQLPSLVTNQKAFSFLIVPSRLRARSSPRTLLFFLSHLSILLFNPCYFDEATQPEVSMTESHTIGSSRGMSQLYTVTNILRVHIISCWDNYFLKTVSVPGRMICSF